MKVNNDRICLWARWSHANKVQTEHNLSSMSCCVNTSSLMNDIKTFSSRRFGADRLFSLVVWDHFLSEVVWVQPPVEAIYACRSGLLLLLFVLLLPCLLMQFTCMLTIVKGFLWSFFFNSSCLWSRFVYHVTGTKTSCCWIHDILLIKHF